MPVPERPRLVPDATTRRDGERYLLLSPARGAWCVVDEAGYRLALQCDGRRAWLDLARDLAARHGVDPGVVERDVAACLRQLVRAGLVVDAAVEPDTTDEGARGAASEGTPALPERLPLEQVTLHLTPRCNLRCRHCYKSPAAEDNPKAMPPPSDQAYAWVDQAVAAGARHLVLTGGEVLTYPGWQAVTRYAAARVATTVMTNGVLLDDAAADLLAEAGVGVQISLDGAAPAVHEALRGPGTFAPTVAGIERILRRGMGQRLVVGICVNRHNLDTADALVGQVIDWGVGRAYILPIGPRGNALAHWSELAVSAADLGDLFRRLAPLLQRHPGRIRLADCEGTLAVAASREGRFPCPLAHGQTALIDSDGWIYPCVLLTGPEHRLGHVALDGLEAALRSPAHERLRAAVAARAEGVAECVGCDWRRFCRGGCPGLSVVRAGEWWTTDGLCGLRDEVFTGAIFSLAPGEG